MTTKKCHACGVEKDVKDFYKSKNSKDGLAPSCKSCQNGKPVKPRQPSIVEEIAFSNVKAIQDQNKSLKDMVKKIEQIPKKSKTEIIHEQEFKHANDLVNDIIESTPNNEPTKSYRIPTRSQYNGAFTWDQVYGDKKCSKCHQNYKEGDEYVVIATRLDTAITRHMECGK